MRDYYLTASFTGDDLSKAIFNVRTNVTNYGKTVDEAVVDITLLDQDGKPVKNSRYIYGAINPYDELTAAQLIEVRDGKTYLRYSKDDVNIEITSPLVIKADQIVSDDTGMGWQPNDPTNPDDDIIIEI